MMPYQSGPTLSRDGVVLAGPRSFVVDDVNLYKPAIFLTHHDSSLPLGRCALPCIFRDLGGSKDAHGGARLTLGARRWGLDG